MCSRCRRGWYRNRKSACQASASSASARAMRRRAASGAPPLCAACRSRSTDCTVARWSSSSHRSSSWAVGGVCTLAARRGRASARSSSCACASSARNAVASSRSAGLGGAMSSRRLSAEEGCRYRMLDWSAPRRGCSRASDVRKAFSPACGARGCAASALQACATATRWAHRLPLSTVDT